MNYIEFKKLSIEEQKHIELEFTHYLCDLNLTSKEILAKLNIPYSTFRTFKKIFNVNRTKEQEYKLRVESRKDKQNEITKKIKQTKLERYGNAGYHNIEKMKQTNLERYGVENVFAAKEILDKKKQTYVDHYGVDHPMKNKDFVENLVKTKKQKDYNYNNPSKSKQTRLQLYGDETYHNIEQMKQTNLERYGVEYACKNPNISQKVSDTWKNKSTEELESIINKRKQTCLEKYGVDNPWKSEEIKDKIKQTLLDKYGVYNSWQLGQGSISKINRLFENLLQSNYIDYEMEFALLNKRYDFKVNNILIEINPTYTHNSTFPPIFANENIHDKPLDKYYHLEKTKLAQENGFRCIHIWDWDNWNKIISLLTPKKKIYARKCKVKEVSKNEINIFLNNYHLQNTCTGQSICYGLYYKNELIQVMTFGKPRYNKKYEYELLRLCTHKDYIVIGGSKKLFNYFLNRHKPNSIISYCDNAKFSGKVYTDLNMQQLSAGTPSKVWSKLDEKITDNLLRQRGFDQLFKTDYGKGTSNEELMVNHGWREVYDCGQSSYSWIAPFQK